MIGGSNTNSSRGGSASQWRRKPLAANPAVNRSQLTNRKPASRAPRGGWFACWRAR